MLRKILYVLIPLWLFQPTINKVVENVDIETVLTAERIEKVSNFLTSNQETLSKAESFGIHVSKDEYVNLDLARKFENTGDLLRNGVYRVSYEWSLFSTAKAQIVTSSGDIVLKTKRTAFPDFHTIAVIGHSIADGAAKVNSPCAVQTLYNWNSTTSALDEITNQSVANNSPALYSYWQPYATKYKAQFSKPVMLINCAQGGSTWYTSALYYWQSGAISLYPAAKAKINAALAATGETLDAIIIDLGINDVRSSISLANTTAAIDDVITKLNGDFPGIPVLVVQVGREETNITSVDLYNIRELMVDKIQATSGWYLVGQPATMAFLSGYEADALHLNSTGNSYIAQCLVNWWINSSYSKWGRSVISSLFDGDVMSSARKTLIDNAVSSQVTNGNYFRLDGWNVFKTTTANNLYIDWSMIGYGVQRTSTFTANSHIATDGSSGRFDMAYTATANQKRSTQNNILVGAKCRTNSSTAVTYLFGVFNNQILGINQNTSPNPIRYLANETTQSNATDILFQADHLYTVGRSGTSKYLYKDATQQATVVQASAGTTAQFPMYIGCLNSSGTAASFTNGTFEYSFVSENTSFDLTSFYNENETLIDGW